MRLVERKLGFDLGSDQIRVWDSFDDRVEVAAARLAMDRASREVLAYGNDAAEMAGRAAANITLLEPVRQGVIADDQALILFLRMMLQKQVKTPLVFHPTVLVSVAAGATTADKQTTVEVLTKVGAREVHTVSQPLAASIGAQVPVADVTGCFLVQTGAAVTEAAAISLGRVVASHTTRLGGQQLKRELAHHLQQNLKYQFGPGAIDQILSQAASLQPNATTEIKVAGKALGSERAVKEITVSARDLLPVLEPFVDMVAENVAQVLAQVPAELAGDAVSKGILLSGAMAEMPGLDRALTNRLKMPVSVVDQPATAVIRGISRILQDWSAFRSSFGYEA